ncbi:hypothetical protein CBL_08393 [Carabus blaptoides fortunei]
MSSSKYYTPKDKNNRLLRCSYTVVDEYSRKFMAIRLNPLKKFKPTVCLTFELASLEDHVSMMREPRGIKRRLLKTVGRNDGMLLTCGNLQATLAANRRIRITVPRFKVKSLKPHELVILLEYEIDRVQKEKKDAWQAVCNDFNSVTTNSKRTPEQLKIAYNNIKRVLKKSSADDKVRLYKTGGGSYTAPQIDDNNARYLEKLKPQFEPIKSRFDSSANYVINDYENNQECTILYTEPTEPVPSTSACRYNNAGPSTDPDPPTNPGSSTDARPSMSMSNIDDDQLQADACIDSGPITNKSAPRTRKKRTISDVYDTIDDYTKRKIKKSCNASRKFQLEIDILEIKKEREKEMLQQEKMNTEIKQIELLIKKKELEKLN